MIINEEMERYCTACTACLQICPVDAISFTRDGEGFDYPMIDENKCIECAKCKDVCPINKKSEMTSFLCYACYNINEEQRYLSTSGGFFPLVADWIIEQGGVVFGAEYTSDWKVSHSFTKKKEDIGRFQKAKYVWSDINDNYLQVKEFVEAGEIVLFAGTPCQVAGLKSFLKKPYRNLYCIDLICGGNNSPVIWERYLNFLEEKYNSKIKTLTFRSKITGWQGASLYIVFKNGQVYCGREQEDWFLKGFSRHLFHRKSCYDCLYTNNRHGRFGDITIGDCWGADKIAPDIYDEKGTSLIIINDNEENSKGRIIFEALKNEIKYKKMSFEAVVKYNKPVVEFPTKQVARRKSFFDEIQNKNVVEAIEAVYGKSKYQQRAELLLNWWNKKNQGNTVTKYLSENNIECVAIYGFGQLGKLLYEDLKSVTKVKYIIDKKFIESKKEMSIEYLSLQDIGKMKNVDLIIITVINWYEDILYDISQKINIKMISLENIIKKM